MARSPKRHLIAMLLGAATLMGVGALAGTAVLLSGVMSTAATKQHFLITHRILDVGLDQSVGAAIGDIEAPPLDSPAMRLRGAACYQQHCATCHGAPGIAPSPAALGMLPVPSNLAHTARQHDPEWLYYVTRKGVRMTGMPAWEYRIPDESLWSTVALLESLPDLDADAYRDLVDQAASVNCVPGGESTAPPESPQVLLRQYACHSCHRIDGVVGPEVDTGPPLEAWPRRAYIGGTLPNTHANLVRWLRDPKSVSPQTLMPDLGVTPEHARVMADYLFAQR
jgi:mono/diheme cytochrome c family protein